MPPPVYGAVTTTDKAPEYRIYFSNKFSEHPIHTLLLFEPVLYGSEMNWCRCMRQAQVRIWGCHQYNIRWEPGAVYDSVLQLVQQPSPPVSFDEEISSNRSMAEQRVGIPDFGVASPSQPTGNKTATETNVITNVMQQSNDLRALQVRFAEYESDALRACSKNKSGILRLYQHW